MVAPDSGTSAQSAAVVLFALALGCGESGRGSASGAGAGAGGTGQTDGSIDAGGVDAGGGAGLVWPNEQCQATSDPWIAEHHDQITSMRPRVLALNFVNARTNDEMMQLLGSITAAIREATRPHGYSDKDAAPFLDYQIAYAVDLRDQPPPGGWAWANSTLYPREQPVEGYWGFDYEALFSQSFADLYGIEDPASPGKKLALCELNERGLVHEVWIYGDADVPDVGAAEVLGIQPRYDGDLVRIGSDLNRCAGNGCFDTEDDIPETCTRTLRIGWVNNTRGVGCYMESLSHGIETIGKSNDVPYLTQYFPEFGGFDLDQRYGLPFDSWYACTEPDCLTYPNPSSVTWKAAGKTGTIDPYTAVCGNAHFPPNARGNYDVVNEQPVDCQCRSYRQNGGPVSDPSESASHADWKQYESIAPDCTGQWLIWWWQNFPGRASKAKDASGQTMKNWWPFLFY